MPTPIYKLTATAIDKLIKAGTQGRHGDGGGLYLQITGGSAAWVFRYIRDGRERMLGLGPARDVSLAAARDKAQDHRAALARGHDPQSGDDEEAPAEPSPSFEQAAKEFIVNYCRALKNEKHREQVGRTLEVYVYPRLGRVPVNRITINHVLKVLEPIWHEIPETASRIRGRIEKVLGFAKVKGWRKGENPAAWNDNLEHALASPSKLRENNHHAALDYRELPEFMHALRTEHNGVSARALEFLILNNCRTADIIGVPGRPDKPPVRWCDIDFVERTWTIPKSKASAIGHKKPLTARSMAILTEMRGYQLDDATVFPSLRDRPGQPLSASALRSLLRQEMGRTDVTVHGFRATFKTWAGEETATPFEVVEASMAHGIIKDKVEAAYRRQDFFAKRRVLMAAWADYAGSGSEKIGGKVIPMR